MLEEPFAGSVLFSSEELLGEGAELPPAALEPYCLTHSSRWAPVMSRHWFGTFSVLLSVVVLLELDGSALELLGAELLSVLVEGSLDDCAHAALASSAAATAAVIEFSVMKISLGEWKELRPRCRKRDAAIPAHD